MHSTLLSDGLWQSLIDELDAGILIFDDSGVVVYANNFAGELLDYPARDVLGLDRADFLALCQTGRLDASDLHGVLLGEQSPSTRTYAIATASRRLSVRVVALEQANLSLFAVTLRPMNGWRANLIADKTLNEMQSPLSFASSYIETLVKRLNDDEAQVFELHNLARIGHDSVQQAMALWEGLRRLEMTGAWALPSSAFEPIYLLGAMQVAVDELKDRSVRELPELLIDLSDDLPPVSGALQLLHVGLSALLEGAVARLKKRDLLVVTASPMNGYLQIDITAGPPDSTLQAYLLDQLPFAIGEQAILLHGGRIWFTNAAGQAPVCSFSLPVWSGSD